MAEDGVPPPTSPASILFEDQRIEGSAVVVQSLTLPATGFVVLQAGGGVGCGVKTGHAHG